MERQDIASLAITSLSVSLCLVIIIQFAEFVDLNKNNPTLLLGDKTNEAFTGTIGQMDNQTLGNLNAYTPDQLGCDPANSSCQGLRISQKLENTGFDPIQALLDLPKIVTAILKIIGLTVIAPLYISYTISQFVTNPFILFMVAIFGIIWQIGQTYLIIMFLVKE